MLRVLRYEMAVADGVVIIERTTHGSRGALLLRWLICSFERRKIADAMAFSLDHSEFAY